MNDLFCEDKFTPVKGLIRRYRDRALIELTMKCPVYCEFCFRKWKRDECREELKKKDINRIIEFLKKHRKIKQIIFSGGEPLMNLKVFEYAFEKIKRMDQIKILRIHTRAVVTVPKKVTNKLIKILKRKTRKPIYLSLHINSIEELNSEVEESIKKIRETGVILYSQSVFLRGINDDSKILEKLFKRLTELGVRPYNIYHCNGIEEIKHFVVPLKREIEIMTELRRNISGFACPTLIIDAPGSANKIPVPLDFWRTELDSYKDFKGRANSL